MAAVQTGAQQSVLMASQHLGVPRPGYRGSPNPGIDTGYHEICTQHRYMQRGSRADRRAAVCADGVQHLVHAKIQRSPTDDPRIRHRYIVE